MAQFRVKDASHRLIHQFENLKRKLYNCKASIYFNRQCLTKKLTPSYARIKIPNTSPAHKHAQQKATTLRIKDKINYLYSKEQKLNIMIYHLHLRLANSWSKLWLHIQQEIEEKLQKECSVRYHTLDNKFKRLTLQQKNTHAPECTFHPSHKHD